MMGVVLLVVVEEEGRFGNHAALRFQLDGMTSCSEEEEIALTKIQIAEHLQMENVMSTRPNQNSYCFENQEF